ncbi:3007_t:CDS:1, partial [Racocetra fulgida]
LSQDSNSQEDAEPLDPTDDDLNDSYDEILVEDGSELLEDLEEINSEDIDSDEAENDR